MSELIRILLLSGSNRYPSHTRTNMDFVADLLREHGAHPSLWDTHEDPLPMHDPTYHRDPYTNPSPAVRRLAHLADEADAFVWGTPVYHNGPAAVLKNALDNLTIRQFRHKPVALISNGGERSGVQPCDQLRVIARGLLAVAIPTQIVTIEQDFMPQDGRYVLVDPNIQDRFARLADELMTYIALLRPLQSRQATD